MTERKVVSRNVPIGLGVACIVLVAGLLGVFAYYTMKLNERANYIVQLETWLQQAKDEKSALQNQYNDLQSIANLEKQETILSQYTLSNDKNTHSYVASVQTDYAGYLQLSMTTTTSNAYVIVEYTFKGELFSFRKTLGTSGTGTFVILPPGAAIYVGNTNLVNGATYTITATYHY